MPAAHDWYSHRFGLKAWHISFQIHGVWCKIARHPLFFKDLHNKKIFCASSSLLLDLHYNRNCLVCFRLANLLEHVMLWSLHSRTTQLASLWVSVYHPTSVLQAQPSDNIWRILPVSCPLTILWAGAIEAQAIPMINSPIFISLFIRKGFLNIRTWEEGKHRPLAQSQALLEDKMKVRCVFFFWSCRQIFSFSRFQSK